MDLSTTNLNKLEKVCKICTEAKHTKTKFNNARVRAKRLLQIIHSDFFITFVLIIYVCNKCVLV